jgi:hypothetical protein
VCYLSVDDWATFELPSAQSGIFDLYYIGRASSLTTDGVFFLSNDILTGSTGWSQASVATRFSAGNIEAANGTAYGAETPTSYTPGQRYCVHLKVNVPQNTYNMYVSSNLDCSSPVTIATDYSFRVASNSIRYYTVRHSTAASGTFEVCDVSLNPPVTSSGGSTSGVIGGDVTSTEDAEISHGNKLEIISVFLFVLLLSYFF